MHTTLRFHAYRSVAWDPPRLAAGGTASIEVTLIGTGVQAGEVCSAGLSSLGPLPMMLSGHVSAADRVMVTLFNPTLSEQNVANGTLRVAVTSFAW